MSDPTPSDPARPSRIVAVAGANPVTGVDSYVIEFDDGETQTHEGPWSEARELADRAGLDHRRGRHPLDPLGTARSNVARRRPGCGPGLVLDAPSDPPPSEPVPSLIPPAWCRQTPTGPLCDPLEVGPLSTD